MLDTHTPRRTHIQMSLTLDRAVTIQPQPQRMGVVRGPITHWPTLGRSQAGGWLGLCLPCSFCVAVTVLREEGSV